MPGPPPNPNARRRNARVGVVLLPSEGRTGEPPQWPLPDDPSLTARIEFLTDEIAELEEKELADGELSRADAAKWARKREALRAAEHKLEATRENEVAMWSEAWSKPQAVEWERQGWTREVAQYVRWKTRAELGDLAASKEARMLSDRLGLNPKAMRALLWQIVEDEGGARRQPEHVAATGTDGPGATIHVLAVDDDTDED